MPVKGSEEHFLPLARPDIQETDIQAVVNVLRSGMLVQGEHVMQLEKKLSAICQVEHAVAASNGTATLHLALKTLGIGLHDEVIVPAFSYIATANAIELTGATPVFVDIDLKTFNIQADQIERVITPRCKAILPVHEFGMACDIETICAVADAYNLYVIEDAACALGARYRDKPVGSFGDVGSFSLHPRKSITAGEGGVLVTNDHQLATKFRQLRNHGIEIENGAMQFVEAGFNYRLTDFQAALASSQFERLDSILGYKAHLASIYSEKIKHSGISLPSVATDRNHTWQTFHIMLEDGMDRQRAIHLLREKRIGTNYGAQCIPAQKYYLHKYKFDSSAQFPNAWKAFRQGLAIPLYERLTEEDVHYIAKTLNSL